MTSSRRVLFLMGPPSLLWRDLAQEFENAGHQVFKIHFSLGDQLFWWRRGGVPYRGRHSRFYQFIQRFMLDNSITDVLYYGDRNHYHVIAQDVAKSLGVKAIAIENGYLRPDWITLERGGMGMYSHFPSDPATIRAIARQLPPVNVTPIYRHGFLHEITMEISYSMISYFWMIFYPFFRFNRYYDPFLEYITSIPHLFTRKKRQVAADRFVESVISQKASVFVVALQLQGDQQIISNSRYGHLSEFIHEVILSFSENSKSEDIIVFKQHPHDNHRENWSGVVSAAAKRHGIEGRVHFIDGGDLGKLLGHAKGCVVVNSTVGLFSLQLGCPTKVMGVAVYDMPGLTHSGILDEFWNDPGKVDSSLVEDFIKVMAETIQVRGSFFNSSGREVAIREIVRRISSERVNEPGGFIDPPPRLVLASSLERD